MSPVLTLLFSPFRSLNARLAKLNSMSQIPRDAPNAPIQADGADDELVVAFSSVESSGNKQDRESDPNSGKVASSPTALDALFNSYDDRVAFDASCATRAGWDKVLIVSDFDPQEDALVVETAKEDNVDVVRQTVHSGGVVVTFDNGSAALLQGLTKEISAASIIFVSVEGDIENNETPDECIIAPTHVLKAADPTNFFAQNPEMAAMS